jgi:hypothetical protein
LFSETGAARHGVCGAQGIIVGASQVRTRNDRVAPLLPAGLHGKGSLGTGLARGLQRNGTKAGGSGAGSIPV